MKRALLILAVLTAAALTAQSLTIYALSPEESTLAETAYARMLKATAEWRKAKSIIKERNGIAAASDIDLSPDFTQFVIVPSDAAPLIPVREVRHNNVFVMRISDTSGRTPVDIEALDAFAVSYNAYARSLRAGIIDLRAWTRVRRAWHVIAE